MNSDKDKPTCRHHSHKFWAKMAVSRKSARVWMKILEVSSCDALLCTQEVRVLWKEGTMIKQRKAAYESDEQVVSLSDAHPVSRVADSAYPRVFREQVGKDPAHLRSRENTSNKYSWGN